MKIAVLISGGVDSAVVVHKLFSEGHDLHLFYIKIGMDNGEGDCNSDEDIELCELIAKKYNLPFDIIPLHEEYWAHVMKYALDSVKKGLTPNPDMMCNKIIKFGFFENRVGKNFDKTATGHYAGVIEKDGKFYLSTAKDPIKDQTDFLAQISHEQLSHLIFPLGDMMKSEVRETAKEAGLPNFSRKDSQGICFLGKIDYDNFIKRHLGEKEGPIIEIETGKKIGVHKGFWFFTIGQRKGIGLSGGPWFVVKKNTRDNVIYVSRGENSNLNGRKLFLTEPNWITENPFDKHEDNEIKVSFKIRHTPEFIIGVLKQKDDFLVLESEKEVQGIAPGQYAVIYSTDNKICIGSALITSEAVKKNKKKTRSGK